jgi:hypothetical protein
MLPRRRIGVVVVVVVALAARLLAAVGMTTKADAAEHCDNNNEYENENENDDGCIIAILLD